MEYWLISLSFMQSKFPVVYLINIRTIIKNQNFENQTLWVSLKLTKSHKKEHFRNILEKV